VSSTSSYKLGVLLFTETFAELNLRSNAVYTLKFRKKTYSKVTVLLNTYLEFERLIKVFINVTAFKP
jgi:hypothetical protein